MYSLFLALVVIIVVFFPKINIYIYKLLITSLIVEFLAQYFTSLNFWWKIDVLTIYLFVWQLISLVISWICLHLLPPILIIEQGSFCVIMALITWIWYFVFFRYIPLIFMILWFGFFSVIDM